MAGQGNVPQRGWYDEIMRRQYYDELIPAYEALQEQICADYDLSPVCMGLAKACTRLPRLVRRLVDGFRLLAERSAVRGRSRWQARHARAHPG
jgi:hypothetical protein